MIQIIEPHPSPNNPLLPHPSLHPPHPLLLPNNPLFPPQQNKRRIRIQAPPLLPHPLPHPLLHPLLHPQLVAVKSLMKEPPKLLLHCIICFLACLISYYF